MESEPTFVCAVCGDHITHDWAGEPTHVSRPDDHAPIVEAESD